MGGLINLRTDCPVTDEELNILLGGSFTKAEMEAAVGGAARLAAAPSAAGLDMWVGDKHYFSAYNETGGATVIGQVVTKGYSNDYGVEVIANATTAFTVKTAVSLGAVAEHALAWWQDEGDAEALVDGDSVDVAAGDFLEVLNGGTAFTKDGAARTAVSAAVAVDANAGAAALKTVRLIGEQHTIAAS